MITGLHVADPGLPFIIKGGYAGPILLAIIDSDVDRQRCCRKISNSHLPRSSTARVLAATAWCVRGGIERICHRGLRPSFFGSD